MNLSIRPARDSDAAAVTALTSELGYDVDASDMAARLGKILQRPDQCFLVAESGGRSVGWLHAAVVEFVETGAFVIVAGLVVDRGQRRLGIGRMLMAAAERWAREQGCSIVRLWSSEGRVEAHAFYRRLGYADIKIQHAFAKCLDEREHGRLKDLVPRLEDEG